MASTGSRRRDKRNRETEGEMAEEAEFGGKCAFAVAMAGPEKAPAGKAKYSLDRDGKTYYFYGAVPRMLFKTFGLAGRAEKKAGGRTLTQM
jgi:hypothetical protein